MHDSWKWNKYVSVYLQVWYALCYLVLRLQDEAVVNFSEAVAGSDCQNLWLKHEGQTANQSHEKDCGFKLLLLIKHERTPVCLVKLSVYTHTSSYTFLAPLLSPSNRWATPRSFFRLTSSGKIWVNLSRVARDPRIRPEKMWASKFSFHGFSHSSHMISRCKLLKG